MEERLKHENVDCRNHGSIRGNLKRALETDGRQRFETRIFRMAARGYQSGTNLFEH